MKYIVVFSRENAYGGRDIGWEEVEGSSIEECLKEARSIISIRSRYRETNLEEFVPKAPDTVVQVMHLLRNLREAQA